MELDDNLRFEIKAAAFERMTGMLAPGKDSRQVTPSREERSRVWGDWLVNNEEIIDAFIGAIEKVL